MPYESPRLLPLGDTALTVEFGRGISPATHARVLGFARALEAALARGELSGVVEWVSSFRSLTVHFDPAAVGDDPAAQAAKLLALARSAPSVTVTGRRWRIPVCFDVEFGPDLDALAAARALTRSTVIERLTAASFRVYMLGFLPGFAYLGGLPEALEMPRRATPRTAVPARTLAVAGRMCAVYPWESPGGWHLLGRTPVRLFDAVRTDAPALFRPGDEVRWTAIDRAAYEVLEGRAARGDLDRDSLCEDIEVRP